MFFQQNAFFTWDSLCYIPFTKTYFLNRVAQKNRKITQMGYCHMDARLYFQQHVVKC